MCPFSFKTIARILCAHKKSLKTSTVTIVTNANQRPIMVLPCKLSEDILERCSRANWPKTPWNDVVVQTAERNPGMALPHKLSKDTLEWCLPCKLFNETPESPGEVLSCKLSEDTLEQCCRENLKKIKNTPKCSPYVTVYTRFTKLTHFNQTLLRMALMVKLNTLVSKNNSLFHPTTLQLPFKNVWTRSFQFKNTLIFLRITPQWNVYFFFFYSNVYS